MDMFEIQKTLYKLQGEKAISDADFKLLFDYVKEQNELIEALRQENLILRKELDPSAGERMITRTG